MPTSFKNEIHKYPYVVVVLLICLQIIIGCWVIIWTEYSKRTLGRYVHDVDRSEIEMKFFIIQLYGLHLVINYICGLPLIRRCAYDPYTTHLVLLLKLWHLFIFIGSLDGFVIMWICSRAGINLIKSVEISLFKGIELYYSDPAWRLIWDEFQYEEQCCGVTDYRDWQSLAWIEYKSSNRNEDIPRDVQLLSMTPYSCCKKDTECYENFMPHHLINTWMEMPTINITNINKNGCLQVFADIMETVMCHMIWTTIVVFILQILLLFCMRSLFISHRHYTPLIEHSCDCHDKESQTEISTGPVIANANIHPECDCNPTPSSDSYHRFGIFKSRSALHSDYVNNRTLDKRNAMNSNYEIESDSSNSETIMERQPDGSFINRNSKQSRFIHTRRKNDSLSPIIKH